jgi:hypothetical protein
LEKPPATRPGDFLAPLFNDSRLRGESVPAYVVLGNGVRWLRGLTRGFAGVFAFFFFLRFYGIDNLARGICSQIGTSC